MNNTKFDFIPNARKFLEAFVTSNYPQFFQDMGEYKPQSGYGNFSNSSKIVQCMRDITHILEEEFSDLSIPEKFVTSNDLISRARNFIEHLKSFDHYFNESYDIYETKITDIPLPAPINEIDKNRLKTIEAFKEFINLAEQEKEKDKLKNYKNTLNDIEKIENLIEKFHSVARQIQIRRNKEGNSRQTLQINDEYDVQDLLHGLLKIYFDNIRREEYNPSYAGSTKRSDFLLKDEKIKIEVKKTRPNLKDKEVGEQLIIDIANYRQHPDCKTLICFIYDPDNFIVNPRGIEKDLKSKDKNFEVLVYIRPK